MTDSLFIHTDAELLKANPETAKLMKQAYDLRPDKLRINPLWWKFSLRCAALGRNLLVVGPSGCGKTLLANALKTALGREDKFFYLNMGSTQDARSSIIGNTHFNKKDGTYVAKSYFVKAIETEGAIILLDEISRAHPEVQNILMTVLDYTQRYLRIDEDPNTPTIHVAKGVCFIMTANIGTEYATTRMLDRALLDRCDLIQLDPMSREDEFENLCAMFPEVARSELDAIADIVAQTRTEVQSDVANINTIISTRKAEEIAAAVRDGFTLADAAEIYIYPFYDKAGGAASAQSFMRALVQKYLPTYSDDATSLLNTPPPGANNPSSPFNLD